MSAFTLVLEKSAAKDTEVIKITLTEEDKRFLFDFQAVFIWRGWNE